MSFRSFLKKRKRKKRKHYLNSPLSDPLVTHSYLDTKHSDEPVKTGLSDRDPFNHPSKSYFESVISKSRHKRDSYTYFLHDGTPLAVFLKKHHYSIPKKVISKKTELFNSTMYIIKFDNDLVIQEDRLNKWCYIVKLPAK